MVNSVFFYLVMIGGSMCATHNNIYEAIISGMAFEERTTLFHTPSWASRTTVGIYPDVPVINKLGGVCCVVRTFLDSLHDCACVQYSAAKAWCTHCGQFCARTSARTYRGTLKGNCIAIISSVESLCKH